MEKLHISAEGLRKLQEELAACRSRTKGLSETIEHARGFGDLRENAEYHAAKEAQAMLHAQIRDLEDKIARAVVVDDSAIDPTKALLGATVRVLNLKTSKEFTYTLVSPVEADLPAGKISVRSPVGEALLGKSAGDEVIAKVPAGDLTLRILSITRE